MELNADFYVATSGDDTYPGTQEKPFASLARARDAVRELKGRRNEGDILVYIRGGRYSLTETVVFGLEDSGGDTQTITYEAYPDEQPVFTSGVRITAWRELGAERPENLYRSESALTNVWVADLPSELDRFNVLYDGDQRLPRARSAGFGPVDVDSSGEGGVDSRSTLGLPGTTLHFPPGKIKRWNNLEDVEILIRPTHGFVMNILGLESVDEEACTAKTTLPGTYPLRRLTDWWLGDQERSVWVENVLEALDGPGKWVLNTRERKLYLWPRGDEPGNDICAPCLRELIKVEGNIDVDGPRDTPVRNLVFRGLVLTQGDRGTWLPGEANIQHDWEVVDKDDALVRFRGAENCVVETCRFFNSGGSALRLDLHCQGNRVVGNEIDHLGGAGILLLGYGPGTKDVNKQNEVLNNHIHHCGQIYWHSHGIVLWQSGENRVAHNTIHHMPRKAICLAGARTWFFDPARAITRECSKSIRWHEIEPRPVFPKPATERILGETGTGYQPGKEWDQIVAYLHSRRNVVEYNEAYRTGEILSDGACINDSGTGEGNVIRRNYVHDIINGRLHVAIRVDDIQRKTLIEENVVYRCKCGGFCLRHENYLINNIAVDVGDDGYVWTDDRWSLKGSKIIRNIFCHPGETPWIYTMAERNAVDVYKRLGQLEEGDVDQNLYYTPEDNAAGAKEVLEGLQQYGSDKNGVAADPLFVDLENGDFRLKEDSPAHKMGIKSIDVSEMGLTDELPRWST